MFNKFKNNEIVIVSGIGECNEKVYTNIKATIICRDPYYYDYNIKFEDGTEDWIKEVFISKLEGEQK